MNVSEHLLRDIKALKLSQKIVDILDLMEELKYSHLPVVDDECKYLGLVGEDDLLEAENEEDSLSKHIRFLKMYHAPIEANLFEAIRIIGEGNLSLLPIVDVKEDYQGYISPLELIQDLGLQMTFVEKGSVIVLEIPNRDYQLSQIAQIVESDDARIIGFHLYESNQAQHICLALKINLEDISRIIKSFERYNYIIKEVYHQSLFNDNYTDRYESLMKYLNL